MRIRGREPPVTPVILESRVVGVIHQIKPLVATAGLGSNIRVIRGRTVLEISEATPEQIAEVVAQAKRRELDVSVRVIREEEAISNARSNEEKVAA